MSILDPTAIETTMCDAIRNAGICDNVWPNRPRSSQSNLASFIVVRAAGPIRSLTGGKALGECTISISLFSRNVNNAKNSKKLSVMQDGIEGLPLILDNLTLKPFSFSVLGDRDDGDGYHFRLINVKAFINKKTE